MNKKLNKNKNILQRKLFIRNKIKITKELKRNEYGHVSDNYFIYLFILSFPNNKKNTQNVQLNIHENTIRLYSFNSRPKVEKILIQNKMK